MINNIKEKLFANSTNKLKDFSNSLIPNSFPVIGCKIPYLRSLAKEIVKGDYKLFLSQCDDSYFEIQMLEAFVIASAPITLEERFSMLDKFIPKIRDWAVHDGLVSTLKCTKKYKEEFYSYILRYKNSKSEFEVRFLCIMLMSYYIEDNYIDNMFDIIEELYLDDYYAKMGAAWLIATIASKYPNEVLEFLKKTNINNWTVNKSISKMRESYRVNEDIKELASSLRRK